MTCVCIIICMQCVHATAVCKTLQFESVNVWPYYHTIVISGYNVSQFISQNNIVL